MNLNGLTERNEFNSSFDAVIDLPPVGIAACEVLLAKRGFSPAVSRLLGILSGGVPRELIRLAELVDSVSTGNGSAHGAELTDADRSQEVQTKVTFAACEAMRVEALELRREVVTATAARRQASPTNRAKCGVFQALSEEKFRADTFVRFAGQAMAHYWSADWADSGWEARFAEAWRRLLVRLHVAGRIVAGPEQLWEDQVASELQGVVAMSSHSAAVARSMVDPSFTEVLAP